MATYPCSGRCFDAGVAGGELRAEDVAAADDDGDLTPVGAARWTYGDVDDFLHADAAWPGAASFRREFRRIVCTGEADIGVAGAGGGGVVRPQFDLFGQVCNRQAKKPGFAEALFYRLTGRFLASRFAELPAREFLQLHPPPAAAPTDCLSSLMNGCSESTCSA